MKPLNAAFVEFKNETYNYLFVFYSVAWIIFVWHDPIRNVAIAKGSQGFNSIFHIEYTQPIGGNSKLDKSDPVVVHQLIIFICERARVSR